IGPGFAVPQFKALHKAIALQRDGAAVPAASDHVAHLEDFGLAVAIVDHDAVELDRRVLDANLQETVAAGGLADFDIVMVMLAVNVRLAKIDPAGCVRRWGHVKHESQSKNRNQDFLHCCCSPLKNVSLVRGPWFILRPRQYLVKL